MISVENRWRSSAASSRPICRLYLYRGGSDDEYSSRTDILAGPVSLIWQITEVLNEFHFKTGGVDEVDVAAIRFIGTILGDGKARFGQPIDNDIQIVGDKTANTEFFRVSSVLALVLQPP